MPKPPAPVFLVWKVQKCTAHLASSFYLVPSYELKHVMPAFLPNVIVGLSVVSMTV